jgi:uncharacterized membrane protein YidH (DUF202 family)
MQYHFSIGAFFIGLLILAAGVAFVKWYQVIADNMGGGVSSYDRYRMWAFITCGVGLLVMTNLHTFILVNLLKSVFPGI